MSESHTMTISEALKLQVPDNKNNRAVTLGTIGGIVMAMVIGVLTSIVVKGKIANNSLEEEIAQLREKMEIKKLKNDKK